MNSDELKRGRASVLARAMAGKSGNGIEPTRSRGADQRAAKQPIVRRTLAEVEPESVAWLWSGRVPFGKLTVLEGDPGLGKSTLTLFLAAAVSAGLTLPDGGRPEAADVLLISFEDGIADTIKPRLVAAGADCRRVHVIEGVKHENGVVQPLSFPTDVSALEREIRATGAGLVVLDPLGAALSAQTDSYKDGDVRRALAPLTKLAEETGCAIIVVRHFPKGSARSAVMAGAGSIGITAAARVVLAMHASPENSELRVLCVAKCNVARKAASLLFHIEEVSVDGSGMCPRIAWDGTSSLSADDLTALRVVDDGENGATDEAKAYLRQALADGPKLKREVIDAAKIDGIASRTLERAAQHLSLKRSKPFGGSATWALPGTSSPTSTAQ